MSVFRLLDSFFGALAALSHPAPVDVAPPVPVVAPVVATAPSISDAELLAAADRAAQADAGETIEVVGDAPAESASSVHLGRDVLRYRSHTQPSDLLRQIPGLVVSQHAGGGKSDQYFIRGFDADHGTDIAIFADGVPVNLSSHGHGQGYADTHWMIPETVASVDMHKGPYAARYGDFYTAGALELKTIDNVGDSTVWIAAGAPLGTQRRFERYDRRLVGMASPNLRHDADDKTLLALQVAESDGAFASAQDFRQGNALGKWSGMLGPGRLALQTTWYAGKWNQSGQLPADEIAAGRLDRFGSLDPSEGGKASRTSAQVGYTIHDGASTWRIMGYGVSNHLDLFSNFTLYARDQEHGDEIEQTDDRFLYGLDASYEHAIDHGGIQALITAGAQVRADDVETSLWHAEQRKRLPGCFDGNANPCNHTYNRIRNVAAYAEAKIVPTPWLELQPALRIDQFTWAVDDRDPMTSGDPAMTTAGDARKAIASPKLSVQLHADDQVSFFFNAGYGFHSNDARAAVTSHGDGAIARALGGEAGVRMKPHPKARVSADLWYLHLSSEQVWSGDAGGSEPSDSTRRFGLDLEGSVDALGWLSLDANVTWSHATFVANAGNGGALALAPRWMGAGGITVHDKHGFVSVRARGIGDRAGNDAGSLTAEGYLIADVMAGTTLRKKVDLNVTINNALDANWREAQFAEQSRVTPTSPVVEQIHFTPGIPLTATVTAAYRF